MGSLDSSPSQVSRPAVSLIGTNDDLDPPAPGKKYFTVVVAINHTFSRGTIVSYTLFLDFNINKGVPPVQHAASKDPAASPDIDPHYFEKDVGELIHTQVTITKGC